MGHGNKGKMTTDGFQSLANYLLLFLLGGVEKVFHVNSLAIEPFFKPWFSRACHDKSLIGSFPTKIIIFIRSQLNMFVPERFVPKIDFNGPEIIRDRNFDKLYTVSRTATTPILSALAGSCRLIVA